MTNLLIRLVISTLIVLVADNVLEGFDVKDIKTAVVVAVVMGLLNTFLKPVLQFLSFPITVLTLGLFYFVINIGLVYLCAYVVDGFRVGSALTALFFSLALSLTQWIAGWFMD